MSVNLAQKPVLIQSFEAAALSIRSKGDVVAIPVAANSVEGTVSNDSIFRTTEK